MSENNELPAVHGEEQCPTCGRNLKLLANAVLRDDRRFCSNACVAVHTGERDRFVEQSRALDRQKLKISYITMIVFGVACMISPIFIFYFFLSGDISRIKPFALISFMVFGFAMAGYGLRELKGG